MILSFDPKRPRIGTKILSLQVAQADGRRHSRETARRLAEKRLAVNGIIGLNGDCTMLPRTDIPVSEITLDDYKAAFGSVIDEEGNEWIRMMPAERMHPADRLLEPNLNRVLVIAETTE